MRHSAAVSSTHYDFSQIEQSARNRAAVVGLIGGKSQALSQALLSRNKVG